MDIYIYIFCYPVYYLRPSNCPLTPTVVVTQIRGHIAGSSPLPTTVRALHFYREKISALSSLVDSRRIVLAHARRSQQLTLFTFFKINSKSHHGGIRTHGPTLVVFEGYHYLKYTTGATGCIELFAMFFFSCLVVCDHRAGISLG